MKDLTYILKRVIIGVSIALLLYAIKGGFALNVYAKEISSIDIGYSVAQIQNGPWTAQFGPDYNGAWAGWGTGYLYHSIAVTSQGYENTLNIPILRSAVAYAHGLPYACDIGTMGANNATHVAYTYSVKCPVDMKDTGFNYIRYHFQNTYDATSAPHFVYDVIASGVYTFEQSDSASPVIDTSSINSNIAQTNNILTQQQQTMAKQLEEQQKTNDILQSDNVENGTSQGSSFFNDFQSNDHGLSGIITAPLRLLNSLTTASCNPLEFDLPFVHNHVVLPCPRPILENYFGVFFSLWQLITTGLISYNICINIYSKVKDMQNPYNDKIEVLNL